jgi:hypothetical protein
VRTKETKRALKLVLEELGGDIMVSWQEPLPLSRREQILARVSTYDVIEAAMPTPIIPFYAATDERGGRCAILHSTTDGIRVGPDGGTYGAGAKASMVRRALTPIEHDRIAETGVVFEPVVGSPRQDMVLGQRDLMLRTLVAADVNFVLLHGAHALHAWRPDLTLKQVAGRVGLWDGRWWVVPVHQIDGVQGHQGEVTLPEWQRQVGRFVDLVRGPDPFLMLGKTCVHRVRDGVCGGASEHWDKDGVAWCPLHWEKAEVKAGEVERRQAKMIKEQQRLTLFEAGERR